MAFGIIAFLAVMFLPYIYVAASGVCYDAQNHPVNLSKDDCLVKKFVGYTWKEDPAPTPKPNPAPQPKKEDPSYQLLSPLPCPPGATCDKSGQFSSFDPTSQAGSNSTKIGEYANILVIIIIGGAGVLAVVVIVIGGLEYATSELAHTKESAKHKISGAIWGLVLCGCAYIILYQINPDILKTDLTSLQTATVTVDLEADVPQTPVNGKYANGVAVGTVWWDGTPGALTSLPAGVSVYNSQCKTVGQQSCTSTKGLSLTYINTILANCSQCKPLSIQGGTEYWLHGGKTGSTAHQAGNPTVDLGVNAALTAYIKSGTQTSPGRWTKDDISYLDETKTKNHWHAGP